MEPDLKIENEDQEEVHSDDGDNEFTVERVISKRKNAQGKFEYLLKWENFSLEEATWEPEENIGCSDLIAIFEKDQLRKKINRIFPTEKENRAQSVVEARVDKEKLGPLCPPPGVEVKRITKVVVDGGDIFFGVLFSNNTTTLVTSDQLVLKHPELLVDFFDKASSSISD
ncbi:unnamed protein product [Caenorhabditis auriculariae]|uniref:Chromo domain-containing protein n=1 Tax=Caenorhabditis auriculariae TaxID=2777116 RepID=A0A8S1GS68_9PELO|nr:unnamed protein product [Caenorhabditis auriculariae]